MRIIKVLCEYCCTLVPKDRYSQHEAWCRQMEEQTIRYMMEINSSLTSSPGPDAPVHPADSEAGPHVHSEHQTTRIRDALPS